MQLVVEEGQSLDLDMRWGKDSPSGKASLRDTTCVKRSIPTREALSSVFDLGDFCPFVRVVCVM